MYIILYIYNIHVYNIIYITYMYIILYIYNIHVYNIIYI